MKSKIIILSDGSKQWRLSNGKLHREDGPAVEWANGVKVWFYYDQQILCKNNEDFLKLIKLKSFW